MNNASFSRTVLQITDTHLLEDPAANLEGVNTETSLTAVLDAAFAERQPDMVLVTGDIAHEGASVAYARFRSHLAARTQAPLVCLPGNHDLAAAFGGISDPATLHPWRIIAVDSHVDNEVGGVITHAELSRLDAAICAAPEFVIIALHHPVLACGSPWLDKDGVFSSGLRKIAESNKKVRCVTYGHIHQAFERCHNGVLYLGTPSTCYQFEPRSKSFSIDSSLPGYRWLSLSDTGDIDTQVSRISELIS